MITEKEIEQAIKECLREPVTGNKRAVLADLIIIQDYLFGEPTQAQEAPQPHPMTMKCAVAAILTPVAVVGTPSVTAWADTAGMMALCAMTVAVCVTVIAVTMARRT